MKSLSLVLLLALCSAPACSHFTARGRMDRAYARQMKHVRVARERRMSRMRHELAKMPKPQQMPLSEPQISTQTSEGPQSVTSASSSSQ